MSQKTSKKDPAVPAGGNVDKIREIIFGGQMRDYERRFGQLESRIDADLKRMRDDFDTRLTQLDGFVRRELDKLLDKLNTERKERKDSHKQLEKQINATQSELGEEIAGLDERTSKEQMEIRNSMRDTEKSLMSQIQKSFDELKQLVDRQIELLQTDKIDRGEMAEYLTEVAMRLNRDFEMPEPD